MQAIEAILTEWKNIDKMVSVDIDPIRSCLIYGLPGTGKNTAGTLDGKET